MSNGRVVLDEQPCGWTSQTHRRLHSFRPHGEPVVEAETPPFSGNTRLQRC